jgi:hypothetical protein
MQNLRTLFAAAAVCLGLAACADSSPALTAPESARFSGGNGLGSGHRADSTTMVSTSDSDSTTVERGGHTIGSGH